MQLRSSLMLVLWTACVGAAPPEIEEGVDDSQASGERALIAAGPARVVDTGGLGLRLRTGAGSQFAVILVMPEGAMLDVVGGSGAWNRVQYKGQTGWAHSDFLQAIAQPTGKNNLLPWTANTTYVVTQGHNGGSHTGLGRWAWDFGLPVGTPILASHFGTARLVKGDSTVGGCNPNFGNLANYVIIDQGNGWESLYLHLSSVTVAQGQSVSRGDLIGYSGQTGYSCGAHLHFQVQRSPSNGGGPGFYNQSINDVFYDPGFAFDPVPGTSVTSKNGVSNQPRVVDGAHYDPHVDPHGDGEVWDFVMREASNGSL